MDIKTLKSDVLDGSTVAGVYMADGTEMPLTYTQDEEGLHITLPEALDAVDENGRAVKIVFNEMIPDIQGVTFWSDNDFKGTAATLMPGVYSAADLQAAGITADATSSIQVPEGYTVYVYDEGETTGAYGVFDGDAASMGAWNDKVAAVKIIKNTEIPEAIEPEEGKTYQIQLRNNPDYVLAYAQGAENNANVQIASKDDTAENQQWIFTPVGDSYKISPQPIRTFVLILTAGDMRMVRIFCCGNMETGQITATGYWNLQGEDIILFIPKETAVSVWMKQQPLRQMMQMYSYGIMNMETDSSGY